MPGKLFSTVSKVQVPGKLFTNVNKVQVPGKLFTNVNKVQVPGKLFTNVLVVGTTVNDHSVSGITLCQGSLGMGQ